MGKILTPADEWDPDIYPCLNATIARWPLFKLLKTARVKIEVLVQTDPDKPHAPALRVNRNPARAKIKVVGAEERSRGGPDVRITLDGHRWPKHPEERGGIFAHELTHLVVVVKDDEVELDVYDRPRIRTIPDDFALTGFDWVVREYGEHSTERQSFAVLRARFGQQWLPFGDAPTPRAVPPDPISAVPPDLDDLARRAVMGELGDPIESARILSAACDDAAAALVAKVRAARRTATADPAPPPSEEEPDKPRRKCLGCHHVRPAVPFVDQCPQCGDFGFSATDDPDDDFEPNQALMEIDQALDTLREAEADEFRAIRLDSLGLPADMVRGLTDRANVTIRSILSYRFALNTLGGFDDAKAEILARAIVRRWQEWTATRPTATEPVPVVRAPVVPDESDPWRAPVSRLSEHGLLRAQIDRLLELGVTVVGQLNEFDDENPLDVDAATMAAIRGALVRYRKLYPTRPMPKTSTTPKPEDLIRSVIEGLAQFPNELQEEFGRLPLHSLDLPELMVTQLDEQGFDRAADVLAHVERGLYLDRIEHMTPARALMLAEQIAEQFATWSSVRGVAPSVEATSPLVEGTKPNEHGVWPDCERIEIPGIPKSAKCSAEIRVALGDDGLWRNGYDYKHPLGGGGGLPSINFPRFGTRTEAIGDALATLIRIFAGKATPTDSKSRDRAVKAIETYRDSLGIAAEAPPPPPEQPEPQAYDPVAWRARPVNSLLLTEDLSTLALQAGCGTAGELDAWLRSPDSKELEDSARDAFIDALDAVEFPHRACRACHFIRTDGASCPRCRAMGWERTGNAPDDPDDLDEVAAAAWRESAEHSALDIYPDGPREPKKKGRKTAAKVRTWDVFVHVSLGRPNKLVGTVEAKDKAAAIRAAQEQFPRELQFIQQLDIVVVESPKSPAERDKTYGGDDLYTVSQPKKTTPLYLVRASSLKAATAYVKTQHPANAKLVVRAAPLDFETKGFVIQTATQPAAAAAM